MFVGALSKVFSGQQRAKSRGLGVTRLGSWPGSVTFRSYDLGQVIGLPRPQSPHLTGAPGIVVVQVEQDTASLTGMPICALSFSSRDPEDHFSVIWESAFTYGVKSRHRNRIKHVWILPGETPERKWVSWKKPGETGHRTKQSDSNAERGMVEQKCPRPPCALGWLSKAVRESSSQSLLSGKPRVSWREVCPNIPVTGWLETALRKCGPHIRVHSSWAPCSIWLPVCKVHCHNYPILTSFTLVPMSGAWSQLHTYTPGASYPTPMVSSPRTV